MSDPREIQDWLRRLSWSLSSMPAAERDEIVKDTTFHLRDALESGRNPAQALEGFGAPEDYARRFLDGMEVSSALGSRRTGAMLSAVGGRVHRSAVAMIAVIITLALALAAFTALTMLVFKLSDPVHAGLWRNAHEFFIGKIDDPATATDLLGNWIYPLSVLTVAFAWLIGRFVLIWSLRAIARAR